MSVVGQQIFRSSEHEDELRDLSIEDAEELRAFQEKRRWFEGKLKLLEDVAPIYPFVLPIITSASGDPSVFIYAELEQSSYRLPSEEEVRSWQSERDILEEEVLAFDGGDLGRMKAKTREVTLVPLTKPSTHLVSITLDLILLIDRLLSLLRRRYDILELVGLRLKWDELRWKVMLECKKIKEDLQLLVEEQGQWTVFDLEGEIMKKSEPVTPIKRSTVSPTNGFLSSSLSIAPNDSPQLVVSPRTPPSPLSIFSPQSSSPYGSTSTQSSLQNLSARHRVLISTHLKRSSALLDRMIDLAGPLKGLGGVHGPMEGETEDSGALPDELLDVQDDLDAMCEDVKGRLDFYKQVERQRVRARRYQAAVLRAKKQADSVILQLKESLSRPATSEQHQVLASLLHDTKAQLSAPIDHTVTRPIHPDYPDVNMNTHEMMRALKEEGRAVKKRCGLSEDGVGWYARIVLARQRLADQDAGLADCSSDIANLILHLRRPPSVMLGIDDGEKRLKGHADIGDEEEWLKKAPDWITELGSLIPSLTVQAQKAESAIMSYESAFLNIPLGLRIDIGDVSFPDDLHNTAADRAENALKSAREAEDVLRRAKEYVEVIPLVRCLKRDLESLHNDIRAVKVDVSRAIDRAAWQPGRPTVDSVPDGGRGKDDVEDLRMRLHAMGQLFQQVQDIRQRIRTWTSANRDDLLSKVDSDTAIDNNIRTCRILLDLLERVDKQKRAVLAIERETEELLQIIRHSNTADTVLPRQDLLDDADRVDERTMIERVTQWSDGLADRVPFVGPLQAASWSKEDETPTLEGTIEISSECISHENGGPSYTTDLRHLDRSVRQRVNELSNRVSTAAAKHENLAERQESTPHNPDLPAVRGLSTSPADVFGILARTQSTKDRLGEDSPLAQIRQLRRRLKSLHLADLVFPSSSAMLRTPSLRRLPDLTSVKAIRRTLAEVQKEADVLCADGGVEEEVQYRKLLEELEAAKAFLPRLDALAYFTDRTRTCEEVFGEMMEYLDSPTNCESESSGHLLFDAEAALDGAEEAGLAVETDRHVVSELKRLRAIWTDLSLSVSPVHSAGDTEKDADDAVSVVSSTQSTVASGSISRIPLPRRRVPSSISIRSNLSSSTTGSGARATSNPFPRLGASTESSRNRTVSSSDTRNRLDSMTEKSSMSSSISSSASSRTIGGTWTGRHTPRTSVGGSSENGQGAGRVPRLSLMSSTSSSRSLANTSKSRTRKSSLPLPAVSTSSKSRISDTKPYISDPKSTLDQAVGKIVNKLKMDVPVVPVNISGTDDWKDQSGRYWIGSKGRAKLCFCRILRSRTVMVRVGGGWVELSRFLLDHFADSLWQVPNDLDQTSTAGTGTMTPIRSRAILPVVATATPAASTLATNPQSDDSDSRSSLTTTSVLPTPKAVPPITPVRPNQALPKSSSGHSLVSLSRSSSFFSPTSTNGAGGEGSGPSSPLVRLHFIRKASESPPVREREKERLGVGRRSILGREG